MTQVTDVFLPICHDVSIPLETTKGAQAPLTGLEVEGQDVGRELGSETLLFGAPLYGGADTQNGRCCVIVWFSFL